MDEKDKILQIKEHPGFVETIIPPQMPNLTKTTNPIAKNFIKFANSSQGKFSLKDFLK